MLQVVDWVMSDLPDIVMGLGADLGAGIQPRGASNLARPFLNGVGLQYTPRSMPRKSWRDASRIASRALYQWVYDAVFDDREALAAAVAAGRIGPAHVRRNNYAILNRARNYNNNLEAVRLFVDLLGPGDAAPFYASSLMDARWDIRSASAHARVWYAMTEEVFEIMWGRVFTVGMPTSAMFTLLCDVCSNGLHRALDTLIAAEALALNEEHVVMALELAASRYHRALNDDGDSDDDWEELEKYNQAVMDRSLRGIASLLEANVPPTGAAIFALAHGADRARDIGIDFATALQWYGTPEFEVAVRWSHDWLGQRAYRPIGADWIDHLLSVHAPDHLFPNYEMRVPCGARGPPV